MTSSTQKDEQIIPHVCPKCGGKESIIARTENQYDCYQCGYVARWDVDFVPTSTSPQGPQHIFGMIGLPNTILGDQKRRNIETAKFKEFLADKPDATNMEIMREVGISRPRLIELSVVTGIPIQKPEDIEPLGRAAEGELIRAFMRKAFDENPNASFYQLATKLGMTYKKVKYWAKQMGYTPAPVEKKSGKRLAYNAGKTLVEHVRKEFASDPNITLLEIAEPAGFSYIQVRNALQRAGIQTRKRNTTVNAINFMKLYSDNPDGVMRYCSDRLNVAPHTLALFAERHGYEIKDRNNYLMRSPHI